MKSPRETILALDKLIAQMEMSHGTDTDTDTDTEFDPDSVRRPDSEQQQPCEEHPNPHEVFEPGMERSRPKSPEEVLVRDPDRVRVFDLEEELLWWFSCSEGEMAPRTNYFLAFGIHGPGYHQPSPLQLIYKARAYRTIRAWLRSIDDRDAGVLQAAYEVRRWPPALQAELGRLTGVAVRIACAHDPWPRDRASQERIEMDRAHWLAEPCVLGIARFDASLARLRRLAQGRLTWAHEEYLRARGHARRLPGVG